MAEHKQNKEIKYLNVCMEKSLHEEFEQFCKDMEQSKTGATAKAVRMYMDTIKKGITYVKCS